MSKMGTRDARLFGFERDNGFELHFERPNIVLASCFVSDSTVHFRLQDSVVFCVFVTYWNNEVF